MKDKTEEMSELYTMDHLNAEYSLIWKAQREAGVLWKDIPSFTEWVLGRLQRAESIVSSLPPSGAASEATEETMKQVEPRFTQGHSIRCADCGMDYDPHFWQAHQVVNGKLYCSLPKGDDTPPNPNRDL